MTAESTPQRDAVLDIAKGLGMILVVIGHCVFHGPVFSFLSTFHMPLFFVISGLCFNEARHRRLGVFFVSRLKTLVFPALVFTVFYVAMGLCLDWDAAVQMVRSLPFSGPPGTLWFLNILFVVEVAYALLLKAVGRLRLPARVTVILLSVLFYVLGCLASRAQVSAPFSLLSALSAFAFYALGHLARPLWGRMRSCRPSVVIPAGCAVLILLYNHYSPQPLSMANNYSVGLADFLPAVVGVVMTFFVSKDVVALGYRPIAKALAWIGRNSLVVLGLHLPFISLSVACVKPLVPSHLLYKLIEQLFVWALCVASARLINAKARWMLGRF